MDGSDSGYAGGHGVCRGVRMTALKFAVYLLGVAIVVVMWGSLILGAINRKGKGE